MNGDLIQDPPLELEPGIPMVTEPAPMGTTLSPAAAYDLAARTGGPGDVRQAWTNLVATGEGVTPARVFPPSAPPVPPKVIQMPAEVPGSRNEVVDLAQQFNIPIASAAAAVQSQIQFQAQRGYQQDLERGMSAADAMAKWGPALFASRLGGRGGYGYGRLPQKQVRMTPTGGVVVFDPITGAVTTAQEGRAPAPKRDIGLDQEINTLNNHILSMQENIQKGAVNRTEGNRTLVRWAADLRALKARRDAAMAGTAAPPAGAVAPPPAAVAPPPAAPAAAPSYPEPPTDPKRRVKDQIYQTGLGPRRWTGTGWRVPPVQ